MSTTPDNEIQPIISATEDRVSEDVRKEIKEQRHVGFVIQESNTSVSSATDASLNEVKETKTAIEGSPGESAVRQIDFLQEHRSGVNVYDHYEEIKLLGVGAFSKIMLVKKKRNRKILSKINNSTQDQPKKRFSFVDFLMCSCLIVDENHYVLETKPEPIQLFALKMIDTSRVDVHYMDALRNEIVIFKSLDHPNIIKAYETFERRRELSIIMELATGGDLYTRRPYTEIQSIRILKKLLSAVAYMHNRNIMHRDLKFENVMFENKKSTAEIKVIDFGLSTKFLNPSYIMRDKVGTLTTVAPDVVRGSYTIKADMWSIGVMAYMLLTGKDELFPGKSKEEIERKILNFRWATFQDHETLNHVSSEAKGFLGGLLEHNPTKRLSAEEALRHPWLMMIKSEMTDFSPSNSIRAAVMDYAHSSELKKLALQVIAYQSSTEQNKKLRRAFSVIDVDKSGEISYDEFKMAFRQSEVVSDVDVENLFDKIDFKREKRIDYTEFVAATIESLGRIEESRIAEAFERLDPDNVGKISMENIRAILSNSESDEYISALLQEADFDGDGMVNYDDFRRLFVEKKRDEISQSLLIENYSFTEKVKGNGKNDS